MAMPPRTPPGCNQVSMASKHVLKRSKPSDAQGSRVVHALFSAGGNPTTRSLFRSQMYPPQAPGEALGTEQLFIQYAPFVAGFIERLGVCANHIEAVTQQVFLLVHQAGGYTPGPATPTSWLGALAADVVARARREQACCRGEASVRVAARRRRRKAPQDGALRVPHALAQLDGRDRALFVLFELEGEDCPSIAAAFQLPLPAVHARLCDARTRFVRAMARMRAA